jgi:hypothetical protein
MDKLLYIFSLVLYPTVLLQIPTDYPRVRSREVPDHWQDQVTWFMAIGSIVLVLLVVGYFMRLDKKMARWFRK